MKEKSKRSGRLVEIAVESIRNCIIDLTLQPGEHIKDKLLMETFNLTRTPLREALNRLAAEGLVDIIPNHGAFVHKLDLSEVEQLFEAYRVSGWLTGFYCKFSDPQLVSDVARMQKNHRSAIKKGRFVDVTFWFASWTTRIVQACENKYIVRFCERMNIRMRRLNYYVYLIESRDHSFREEQLTQSNKLHDKIIEALESGSRDTLVRVLADQIASFRKRVGRAVSQNRFDELPLDGSPLGEKD